MENLSFHMNQITQKWVTLKVSQGLIQWKIHIWGLINPL